MGRGRHCEDKHHDKHHDKDHGNCKPRNREFLRVKADAYQRTEAVYYVDGKHGDDKCGNGSKDKPFETIDRVLEVSNNNTNTIVYATANCTYEINEALDGRYLTFIGVPTAVEDCPTVEIEYDENWGNYRVVGEPNAVYDSRTTVCIENNINGVVTQICHTIDSTGRFYRVIGDKFDSLNTAKIYPLFNLGTVFVFNQEIITGANVTVQNAVFTVRGILAETFLRFESSVLDFNLPGFPQFPAPEIAYPNGYNVSIEAFNSSVIATGVPPSVQLRTLPEITSYIFANCYVGISTFTRKSVQYIKGLITVGSLEFEDADLNLRGVRIGGGLKVTTTSYIQERVEVLGDFNAEDSNVKTFAPAVYGTFVASASDVLLDNRSSYTGTFKDVVKILGLKAAAVDLLDSRFQMIKSNLQAEGVRQVTLILPNGVDNVFIPAFNLNAAKIRLAGVVRDTCVVSAANKNVKAVHLAPFITAINNSTALLEENSLGGVTTYDLAVFWLEASFRSPLPPANQTRTSLSPVGPGELQPASANKVTTFPTLIQ